MNAQTLETFCQFMILLGILLSGFGGLGAYIYGKRADKEKDRESTRKEDQLNAKIDSLLKGNSELNQQIESIEQLTIKFYPGIEKGEAIEKLKVDFEKLKNEFSVEKNTIRDLTSKLRIVFSGKWSRQPYPDQITSPVNHEFYLELENNGHNQKVRYIKLFATNAYQFHTIDKNRAVFESRQAVLKGDYPLGELFDELLSFTTLNMNIPFFLGDDIEGRRIVIEQIELAFILNGEECNPLIINEQHETVLVGEKANIWARFSLRIDPTFLRDMFKVRVGKPDVNL